MWRIKKQMIDWEIEHLVEEQVGQIRQSLIQNLDKSGWHEQEDVIRVSRKIGLKTKMGSIFQNMQKIFSNDGYLADSDEWSKEVAEFLAKEEGVEMTDAQWEIVIFLRDYYKEYNIAPTIKPLVKAIAKKFGPEKGNTKYMLEIFPYGPAKQACKIAGLPSPQS